MIFDLDYIQNGLQGKRENGKTPFWQLVQLTHKNNGQETDCSFYTDKHPELKNIMNINSKLLPLGVPRQITEAIWNLEYQEAGGIDNNILATLCLGLKKCDKV